MASVIFTDESKFWFFINDARVLVRRKGGETDQDQCIRALHTSAELEEVFRPVALTCLKPMS